VPGRARRVQFLNAALSEKLDRDAMPGTGRLRLAGISRPVALIDSAEVEHCLARILRNWPPAAEDGGGSPVLTVRRDARHYRLESPWLPTPAEQRHPVDLSCALIAELVQAFITDNPQTLCLHGAAVAFGAGLVVFPNQYRAGKSLLTACLAASGLQVFGDDVLPIAWPNDQGVALGIPPRLRLPLPEELGAAARRFVDDRRGAASERYLYLDLSPRELAPHGTRAPVRGFVLLDRQPDAAPALLPASDGEVLRQVIWQNFARELPPPEILDRLHRLVAGADCFRLRYAQAEHAVPLLRERFSAVAHPPKPAARRARPERNPAHPNRRPPPPGSYSRHAAVGETVVDGEMFLTAPETGAIHHLNPVAAALWSLLAEPSTIPQMAECLAIAFPDVPRARIRADVEALTGELVANRLVCSHP
jgi:hypothetical protein